MPWPLPTLEADLLRLALAYPFDAPANSFVLRAGTAEPLDGDPPAALFRDRTPVIAHGSNRAPEQLLRKFGDTAEIPVSRAWLADYDVVYSAHVTRYGSIAANLQHAPGTRTAVAVTWLTAAQLTRMHETELGGENYYYGRMEAIDLALEAGPAQGLRAAAVYLSAHGCLAQNGAALGLAAVAAERRSNAALDQAGVLTLVRDRHHRGEELNAFVLSNIRDRLRRGRLTQALRADALAVRIPHFRALAQGESG